jgi:hypothetical protein
MHPYRDIERPVTDPVEQLDLDRCLRMTTAAVRSWSLLRVVVGVMQDRLLFEAAIAAALVVLFRARSP